MVNYKLEILLYAKSTHWHAFYQCTDGEIKQASR